MAPADVHARGGRLHSAGVVTSTDALLLSTSLSLIRSVESIQERSTSLSELEAASDSLAASSQMFYKTAKKKSSFGMNFRVMSALGSFFGGGSSSKSCDARCNDRRGSAKPTAAAGMARARKSKPTKECFMTADSVADCAPKVMACNAPMAAPAPAPMCTALPGTGSVANIVAAQRAAGAWSLVDAATTFSAHSKALAGISGK